MMTPGMKKSSGHDIMMACRRDKESSSVGDDEATTEPLAGGRQSSWSSTTPPVEPFLRREGGRHDADVTEPHVGPQA
jgi:hypothetical protein